MKKIVRFLLERKVKKYLKKHKPFLVVVTGSVGKTSTKLAIATVLAEKFRVRTQDGNLNTDMSVPLAMLGVKYPENPRSFKQWRDVLKVMSRRIKDPKDADVIVQELGTDGPGQVAYFKKYLNPDIAVVTAVSEEHMEFFGNIDTVAQEELSVAAFSKSIVINFDDIAMNFAKYAQTNNISTYGFGEKSEYRLVVENKNLMEKRVGWVFAPNNIQVPVNMQLFGDHSLKVVPAAVCVGLTLGLTVEEISRGVGNISPVPGRMQLLRGADNSIIVDDTYNASPLAVIRALETLSDIDAPKKIAILGSMNELGALSQQAHEQIASICDGSYLNWLVTIGEDAGKYIPPIAAKNGCPVRAFKSPYEAGIFVRGQIEPGTVVLAKGSQNGVFAEEAVKILLYSNDDEDKLVRQSPEWMKRKNEQFSAFDQIPNDD